MCMNMSVSKFSLVDLELNRKNLLHMRVLSSILLPVLSRLSSVYKAGLRAGYYFQSSIVLNFNRYEYYIVLHVIEAHESISISITCKRGLIVASPVQLRRPQIMRIQLMTLFGDGADENAAL